MTAISATMVKDLREKTGAGMMDCKAALTETNGDMEAAVDWLRNKGLAKAAKKAGRIAAEGLIGLAADAAGGAGRGQFRDRLRGPQRQPSRRCVRNIAKAALKAKGDLDKLAAAKFPAAAEYGRRHHQGDGRHDRREHDAPPLGLSRRRSTARSRATCTTRSPPVSARSACMVALESTGNAEELKSLRPPGRHACRRRQPASARCRRAWIRRSSSASARSSPSRRRESGKPEPSHREDGRGPLAQILRGGRAAGAGLRARSRDDRREGAGGGRARRPARRSRSPASIASRLARGSTSADTDFAAEVAAAVVAALRRAAACIGRLCIARLLRHRGGRSRPMAKPQATASFAIGVSC